EGLDTGRTLAALRQSYKQIKLDRMELSKIDYQLGQSQCFALRQEVPTKNAAGTDRTTNVRCLEDFLVYKVLRRQRHSNDGSGRPLVREVTRLRQYHDPIEGVFYRQGVWIIQVEPCRAQQRTFRDDVHLVHACINWRLEVNHRGASSEGIS